MRAPEPLAGLRVVAAPAALDAARLLGDEVIAVRIAPDDLFAIGADSVEVDDADAILEPEAGFVGLRLPVATVAARLEWSLPTDRPALAQGSMLGVPARIWLPLDGDALVVVAAAHAHELMERLG